MTWTLVAGPGLPSSTAQRLLGNFPRVWLLSIVYHDLTTRTKVEHVWGLARPLRTVTVEQARFCFDCAYCVHTAGSWLARDKDERRLPPANTSRTSRELLQMQLLNLVGTYCMSPMLEGSICLFADGALFAPEVVLHSMQVLMRSVV